jgi:hypothetical protein
MDLQAFADSRTSECPSIMTAIAIGPVFLYFGYLAGLVFAAGAIFYFLVSLTIVPVITAFGGRFRFLVWQLAVLSLALSVVIDDLRLEANMRAHLKEYAGVALGFWAISTVLFLPLPIFLVYQVWQARKRPKQ